MGVSIPAPFPSTEKRARDRPITLRYYRHHNISIHKTTTTITMSIKKRTLFGKLMKLVGRGNQVQSTKTCLAQIYEERKKQRQRSSLSSHLSHIEPMPTIQEEDETVFCYDDTIRI